MPSAYSDTEKRICVTLNAMKDAKVGELLVQFGRLCEQAESKKPGSWGHWQVAKQLCLISRRIYWRFITMKWADRDQAEATEELFLRAFRSLQISHQHRSDVLLADFQEAIKHRASGLRLAIDEFDDLGAGECWMGSGSCTQDALC